MRAAYHLAFAIVSVGAIATPTTAPNATDPQTAASANQVIPALVRSIAADISSQLNAGRGSSPVAGLDHVISVGGTLPESVELYPISQHETYRYAVVDKRRVIVDTASRKVVYVIQ
jgi:Protein of unknown function (DUF1236)